jgi:hypothetical protein
MGIATVGGARVQIYTLASLVDTVVVAERVALIKAVLRLPDAAQEGAMRALTAVTVRSTSFE